MYEKEIRGLNHLDNENKLLYTMNALNDFSINQKRYSRILKMEVFVNNEPLNKTIKKNSKKKNETKKINNVIDFKTFKKTN